MSQVGIWLEKKRLTDEFLQAVGEELSLQGQEVAALARGGEAPPGFDLALAAARTKRDRIGRELRLHMLSHACP
jgi:hypothetical protein